MRGSVVKRGAGYSVVIELSPDPATGKRRQKWHSGYATKKEAERARTKLLGQVDDGAYVEHSRQTVAEYMADWLPAIEATVKPATFYSYARNVRLHVIPNVGRVRLSQLDAGALNALYAKLLEGGRADGRGGLSPRSVHYVHTILHRAMKDAVRWGRLVRNPVDAADPPKKKAQAEKPEMVTWSADELAQFLGHAADVGSRHYPAWHLLASTGLRRGEALGLRWSDVDLDAGRAQIRQTVITVNHVVQVGTPKTAKGRRSIALDRDTVQVLRDHRRRQAEHRLQMGAGWTDYGLLFTKVDGSPLHPELFSREFDRRVESWGLPWMRLHDLRHTWATLALQAGVHPKVVSERLGHSTIAITLDTYSHVTPAMQSDAAETVAALFRRSS